MEFERKKLRAAEEGGADRWLLSYADLITLLLALFIVLFAAADRERAAKIAGFLAGPNEAGSGILPGGESFDRQPEIFELINDPLLSRTTKMRQTPEGLVVSLSEAGFFSPGESDIGEYVRDTLGEIAIKLRKSGHRIRIEGHTDSIPIKNDRFSSNWELSTARASSVLEFLIERGISPERLSAAGYGGFQPVADNESAEGRMLNRRVDIVVLNR